MNTVRLRGRLRFEWGAWLFVAAFASVVVGAALFFSARRGQPSLVPPLRYTDVWLAALLYAGSHGLRILRLTVLAGDPRISLRRIGLVHLLTASVSMMTPFKLGEIYRIVELGNLLRNTGHALIVVWIERAFDFAAIAVLIAVASATEPSLLTQIRPLIAMAVLFVSATLVLFTIVPEGLRTMSLFVLRRYDGQSAIRSLQALQWLRQGINLGPQFVAGKVATLLVLTLGIWSLELATFSSMLTSADRELHGLVTGLPLFLSSESMGGGFLHRSGPYVAYSTVVTGTLLLLGAVAAILYAPARLSGILAPEYPRFGRSRRPNAD